MTLAFNWAQSTAINYQGTAKDATNSLLKNQPISIQITIIAETPNGTLVYEENHTTTTSPTALFTVVIGRGTVVTGDFEAIQWGGNAHYVNVALDPSGGTNFSTLGQVELLSVPYAFYAHSYGELGKDGEQGEQGKQGAEGEKGDTGPPGPQGERGDTGPPGYDQSHIKGARGRAGLSFPRMKNTAPNNPSEQDVYLDDGTNRTDGTPGFRFFNGTDWIDL